MFGMDIQDWLQGTAHAPQQSSTVCRDASPIAALSANAVILQKSNSRKRRRSTSTSSVQPLQAHQSHCHERGKQARAKRSATSYGTSAADESHRSERDPYKRRKRRKTRHDRYDVKPAKIRNKSRAKERKKPGSESTMVKNYKAKNVS